MSDQASDSENETQANAAYGEGQWSVDERDILETERVKASYSPEKRERNEKFTKALGVFLEQEDPDIVMNALGAALAAYFTHYYPEQSLVDFLQLMARGYRTELRRRGMQ